MRVHGQLVCNWIVHWRSANGSGGNLKVLLANRLYDVGGGQSVRSDALGVEPHTHGIIAGTEDDHLTRAGNTRQLVPHVQQCIVAEIHRVVSAVWGEEVHDQGEVRGLFDGGHAKASDFFGQFGERL